MTSSLRFAFLGWLALPSWLRRDISRQYREYLRTACLPVRLQRAVERLRHAELRLRDSHADARSAKDSEKGRPSTPLSAALSPGNGEAGAFRSYAHGFDITAWIMLSSYSAPDSSLSLDHRPAGRRAVPGRAVAHDPRVERELRNTRGELMLIIACSMLAGGWSASTSSCLFMEPKGNLEAELLAETELTDC